jgi:hypothetical protein
MAALATSEALMVAVSWLLETNCVLRAEPFQTTVEAETNSVPLTVRTKPLLPGFALSGASGWLMKGVGLDWANVRVAARVKSKTERRFTTNLHPEFKSPLELSSERHSGAQVSRIEREHCTPKRRHEKLNNVIRPFHSKHPNDGGGVLRELFHKVLLKQIL